MDIFISYSFKDNLDIQSLFHDDLEDRVVFLKGNHLPLIWKYYARRKIENSDCICCVISRNALYSSNMEWEVNTAFENGKMIFYYKSESNIEVPQYILRYGIELKKQNIYEEIRKYKDQKLSGILFNRSNYLEDYDCELDNCLFEQYKIMVNTSEELSKRRQNTHKFFVMINGGLFSGFGFVVNNVNSFPDVSKKTIIILIIISMVGYISSYSWARQIMSYRQLSVGKFKIINKMEKVLPAAIFLAEWHALGEGKDSKIYSSFTGNEQNIPIFLKHLYAGVIVGCVIWLGVLIR